MSAQPSTTVDNAAFYDVLECVHLMLEHLEGENHNPIEVLASLQVVASEMLIQANEAGRSTGISSVQMARVAEDIDNAAGYAPARDYH